MKSNKKFVILIEILVITFLVISVVPVCGLSDFSSPEVRQKGFNFYAVYDRLADRDSLNIEIWHTAMSGNGKKLIFCGRDVTTYDIRLYTVNADGSDLTSIPLPAELWIITGVAIDSDGSRAFFMANTRATCIYKVEGGVATQILNISDYYEINECRKIETTADGEYVYIMEDRDDVWKIRHSGGTPVKVIEDTGVPREDSQGHKAWAVKNFAISADGSTIAFILSGYLDPTMYYGISLKKELFVLDGGGYRQLTNDKGNVLEEYLDISGDGTTIVFSAGRPQIKWYSIRSDGSAKIALEDFSFNVAGPVLNYDGTRMFYNDGGANGGRLVNTDGSGSIDLFPCGGSKFPIPLAAHWHTCISDDGNRVSFRYDALYIGHLNDPEAVPDSPIIHNIVFDPPAMPRGDSDALINLTSQISDPQGLADIERTSTVELVDGRLQRDNRNIPVYFPFAANDVGSWTDETAGDGIFSSAGKPGGKIDELDQMTVRMGVMDASKTVVIADKVLSIGGVISTPTPTLTPTPSTTPTETPTPILPTPRPTPEERPDLTISSTDYEFEDEGRVLVLFVKIANQGDTRTKQTRVYAEDPQHDWSGRESMVPAFNPEETETIEIRLDIPDEQRGTTHVFTVEVDPEDEVREIDEGNNIEWTRGIVIPPLEVTPTPTEPRLAPTATPDGKGPDPVPLILIVVAIATLGGITLSIRHYTINQHHKKWQEEAKEEEPPEHCQYCTHHCRKIELELDPAMRKIAYLRLGAYDPVHSEQIKDEQVTGEIVDGLNKVVSARHRRVNAEKLQELVTPQTHALLQQIMGLLREELSPRDVSLRGHLEGGKVTCQFILYHCKRRGNVNIWEEEAKWEATIKDERDELVGILHSIDPAELGIPEQVAPDLTRLLMQFIEKV